MFQIKNAPLLEEALKHLRVAWRQGSIKFLYWSTKIVTLLQRNKNVDRR